MANGVEEMGLSETILTTKIERIVMSNRVFGDSK
jgi:hypothetical protein